MSRERKIRWVTGAISVQLLLALALILLFLLVPAAGAQVPAMGIDTNALLQAVSEAAYRGDIIKLLVAVLGGAVGLIAYLVRLISQQTDKMFSVVNRFTASMQDRPCIYTKKPIDLTPPDSAP